MGLQSTGTPTPSDAVIGLQDDVGRRIDRELEDKYRRGITLALLAGAGAMLLFFFGEISRDSSGAQDMDLGLILGLRVAVSALLAGFGLVVWWRRTPAWLIPILDVSGMLVIGVFLGWLDAYTYGENPLYFGSIAIVAFVRSYYVPATWKLTAVASFVAWLGALVATVVPMAESGVFSDPIFAGRFANLQFFVGSSLGLAILGTWFLERLRRGEIEARSWGRYEIRDRIGAGGYGEVFRAWDNLLERDSAIKMLDRKHGGREDIIERFEREAKATCRLSSPHTVRIYDFGCTRDDRLYYVMEYLRGRDLGQVARSEGALEPRRVVRFMKQAAIALAEAHGKGIIHRDIKPENLFVVLDESGTEQIKVLDFGLATSILPEGSDALATGGSAVIGTPEYMPPERAKGARGDERSDIYALGAVFFHLLTGHLVFFGPTPMAILMAQLRDPPRRPSDLSDQVPDYLDAIVLKCLAKAPEERFATMRALLTALDAAEATLAKGGPAPRWT